MTATVVQALDGKWAIVRQGEPIPSLPEGFAPKSWPQDLPSRNITDNSEKSK